MTPGVPAPAALPALAAVDEVAHPVVLVESAVEVLSERFLAAARESGEASWSAATRNYVAGLWRAVDRAREGAAVRTLRDPDDSLRILVGRAPAIQLSLHAPRPGRRAALEAEIARRMDTRLDGGAPRRGGFSGSAAPAASDAALRPVTTDGKPRAGRPPGDGLSCASGDGRHQRLHAQACARLLGEIRALAGLVHNERAIAPLAAALVARPQRFAGRTLSAPLLQRYPAVRAAALRWLTAHAAGRRLAVAVAVPPRLVYAAPLASLSAR